MRKTTILLLHIFLILFLTTAAQADHTLSPSDFASVTAAFDSLPADAGTVTVYLTPAGSGETETQIEIPADRGITGVLFLPAEGPEKVSLPDLERICANGVPVTIGEGLVLENASVYGGACVSGGETVLESSSVTVSGTVGFVFGGGLAMDGGHTSVSDSFVTLTKTGLVYFEVVGGGHAYGSGSRSTVENSSVEILGTTDYVLGGGFAEEGGQAECTNAAIHTAPGSSVPVALFTGGSASGSGSLSVVGSAFGQVEGDAHWAFSGDFAFEGGETRLDQATRLEILPGGSSAIAYLGSFASDEGSSAYVNTSELMSCGDVSQIIQDGQSTDQGSAVTLIKALFPCQSGPNP